jgi:hypothetical protein
MAYASITYTSASGTTFALTNSSGDPIEYLRQADIFVYVNNVLKTLTTHYTFNSAGTAIVLNTAVSGVTVTLQRITAIDDPTVVYTAGSTLTAQDLNNADNQIRFGLQEFTDYVAGGQGVTDGDKGDITVNVNGSVWTVNSADSGNVTFSSGRLLVGTSTSLRGNHRFQIRNNNGAIAEFFTASAAEITGPYITCSRSRGTESSPTVVSLNDTLGIYEFLGYHGSGWAVGADITALVDGSTINSSSMPTRLVFSTTANGTASPAERMRLDNTGNLMLNTPVKSVNNGTGGTFFRDSQVAGGSSSILIGHANGTANGNSFSEFFYNTSLIGSITQNGTTAVAYNTSSDYRLKENVEPITGAANRILQLKPSRFNFIADPDHTVDGFIAHEAQAVVPECVTGEKDAVDEDGNPKYQGIDQSKLVPLLTAALQEAIAKIETLEARLTAAGIE